jgi:hypothetical protein
MDKRACPVAEISLETERGEISLTGMEISPYIYKHSQAG